MVVWIFGFVFKNPSGILLPSLLPIDVYNSIYSKYLWFNTGAQVVAPPPSQPMLNQSMVQPFVQQNAQQSIISSISQPNFFPPSTGAASLMGATFPTQDNLISQYQGTVPTAAAQKPAETVNDLLSDFGSLNLQPGTQNNNILSSGKSNFFCSLQFVGVVAALIFSPQNSSLSTN